VNHFAHELRQRLLAAVVAEAEPIIIPASAESSNESTSTGIGQ
jgi:hypothetical protein